VCVNNLCQNPGSTTNPDCLCQSDNTCSSSCSFDPPSDNPIDCGVDSGPRNETPSRDNQNNYCRRQKRTQGDANGLKGVDMDDYIFYLNAVLGQKIPPNVNTDFNGDGHTDYHDLDILKQTIGE